jgi:NAD(P)-dependent dehydrogenase (short-subunit alcohol dehydrogenase family)
MSEAKKHVLVTGVSTGIGYTTVAHLLRAGYGVFGSVRRRDDAERLKGEFGQNFTPLLLDVTQEEQVAAAAADVADRVGAQGLWGLVNNAGISLPGPLSVIPASMVRQHLEINVMGVFNVTKAFLPSLGTLPHRSNTPGRVINISSVSGRIAYPFMGAYAASKHALEALSDSWRRELMLYGIDVVVIQPGAIQTPIWDKASSVSADFSDSDYGTVLEKIDLLETKRKALPVEKVARLICHALRCRRPKARYVVPDGWLVYWIAPRLLPDRWLDWIIKRILGMESKRDAAT